MIIVENHIRYSTTILRREEQQTNKQTKEHKILELVQPSQARQRMYVRTKVYYEGSENKIDQEYKCFLMFFRNEVIRTI